MVAPLFLHSDWLTKRTDAILIFNLFSADGWKSPKCSLYDQEDHRWPCILDTLWHFPKADGEVALDINESSISTTQHSSTRCGASCKRSGMAQLTTTCFVLGKQFGNGHQWEEFHFVILVPDTILIPFRGSEARLNSQPSVGLGSTLSKGCHHWNHYNPSHW